MIMEINLSDIETVKWDSIKAQELKKIRGDISLGEVARRSGVTKQYLGRLEKNMQKSVSMSVLSAIHEALSNEITFKVSSIDSKISVTCHLTNIRK